MPLVKLAIAPVLAAAAFAALVGGCGSSESITATTSPVTAAVPSDGAIAQAALLPMTAARLRLPQLGDGTRAAQLTLVASGSGIRQQVYEDVVFTRVGRGVSMLALLSQGTHDDALLAALATRAAERLRDALATDG